MRDMPVFFNKFISYIHIYKKRHLQFFELSSSWPYVHASKESIYLILSLLFLHLLLRIYIQYSDDEKKIEHYFTIDNKEDVVYTQSVREREKEREREQKTKRDQHVSYQRSYSSLLQFFSG
jgi:hypothetical protein